MSVEYVYHCEGPGCEMHQQMAGLFPPFGWLRVVEYLGGDIRESYFHDWECVMKAAARVPPPETTPLVGSDE